jgi:hypothetical protein
VGTAIEDRDGAGHLAVRHQAVVLRGRDVARALDVAADELADRSLIERALATREHARVVDQVLDHRPVVRSVRLRGRQEPQVSIGPQQEPALTRRRR